MEVKPLYSGTFVADILTRIEDPKTKLAIVKYSCSGGYDDYYTVPNIWPRDDNDAAKYALSLINVDGYVPKRCINSAISYVEPESLEPYLMLPYTFTLPETKEIYRSISRITGLHLEFNDYSDPVVMYAFSNKPHILYSIAQTESPEYIDFLKEIADTDDALIASSAGRGVLKLGGDAELPWAWAKVNEYLTLAPVGNKWERAAYAIFSDFYYLGENTEIYAVEGLSSDDDQIRLTSLNLLKRSKNDYSIYTLPLLRDENPNIREGAFMYFYDRDSVTEEMWEQFLNDPDPGIRYKVALLYSSINGDSSKLRRYLISEEDSRLRLGAAARIA
ncbi:MAG: HEAT repeat domain-containing protein, partial [Candidatus Dadabacteria bacterium]|nr:HEAT repeat domain-containing protein [Candidatus Dadabacteria bacterium]